LLDQLGRDLTQLARQGRLRTLFGRQQELLQLQRILLRKLKNNPLIVGAPGVGKTALVEGFANLVVEGKTAKELRPVRIVELSAAALIAGTGIRGMFEDRLRVVIAEASSDPNLILFIDEIHTLIRAGAVEGGALDAANIFKPALANGEIRCIGATTPDEFEAFLRSDSAFERRFELLRLEEPTESEALEILTAVRSDYEGHHHVQIQAEALEASVHLSALHILERRLPDKALDLLDAACAYVRLPDPEKPPLSGHATVVTPEIVACTLSEQLGVPLQKLTQDESARLSGLAKFLNRRLIGQRLAIEKISASLMNAFAGLRDPARPKAVFAFIGSSGVGKTLAAQLLAEFLFDTPDALIRLDMSEFKEAHSVSRLLGSPPGYIGYKDEGTFASRLRRQPFSVVLLDEVEKAHPEVLDAFLQIFDHGRFTDARGRLVEARHAIFILTSNLFTVGKIATPEELDQHTASLRQSLSGYFRIEFVNRIDGIVLFGELQPGDLAQIAALEIQELNRQLERYQIRVEASEQALQWIAQEADQPGSGARAVQRLVAQSIREPISASLISGEIASGQIIEVSVENNHLKLTKENSQ
jgi:ATP-dependent Clp protease ATP-binding subunit ClpC